VNNPSSHAEDDDLNHHDNVILADDNADGEGSPLWMLENPQPLLLASPDEELYESPQVSDGINHSSHW
jgi:hypothetical protein